MFETDPKLQLSAFYWLNDKTEAKLMQTHHTGTWRYACCYSEHPF